MELVLFNVRQSMHCLLCGYKRPECRFVYLKKNIFYVDIFVGMESYKIILVDQTFQSKWDEKNY